MDTEVKRVSVFPAQNDTEQVIEHGSLTLYKSVSGIAEKEKNSTFVNDILRLWYFAGKENKRGVNDYGNYMLKKRDDRLETSIMLHLANIRLARVTGEFQVAMKHLRTIEAMMKQGNCLSSRLLVWYLMDKGTVMRQLGQTKVAKDTYIEAAQLSSVHAIGDGVGHAMRSGEYFFTSFVISQDGEDRKFPLTLNRTELAERFCAKACDELLSWMEDSDEKYIEELAERYFIHLFTGYLFALLRSSPHFTMTTGKHTFRNLKKAETFIERMKQMDFTFETSSIPMENLKKAECCMERLRQMDCALSVSDRAYVALAKCDYLLRCSSFKTTSNEMIEDCQEAARLLNKTERLINAVPAMTCIKSRLVEPRRQYIESKIQDLFVNTHIDCEVKRIVPDSVNGTVSADQFSGSVESYWIRENDCQEDIDLQCREESQFARYTTDLREDDMMQVVPKRTH